LVGSLLIEFACNREKVYHAVDYTISGIDSSYWLTYKWPITNRTRIGNLMLVMDFESQKSFREVSTYRSSLIYALSPKELVPLNNFDSILVSSNGIDYTSSFSTFHEDINLREFGDEWISFGTGEPLSLAFGIKEPLKNQTDTFQFTFQFFDYEGNIFETTTDPIIITP
jgi:hypothetical protein